MHAARAVLARIRALRCALTGRNTRLGVPARLMALGAIPALAITMHYATVRSGDTLSGIAARACGHANDWTGIYAQNRKAIGGNPNLIEPGQHYAFKCDDPPALLKLGHAGTSGKVWGKTYGYPNKCGDGDGDGWDVPCSSLVHPAARQAPASRVSLSGYSGFQACVIARESGGNAQVWNASGHYGLYQFSASTWAAYGGSPADFGHASAAEQTRVFESAMAAGGQSNWSPYDGC